MTTTIIAIIVAGVFAMFAFCLMEQNEKLMRRNTELMEEKLERLQDENSIRTFRAQNAKPIIPSVLTDKRKDELVKEVMDEFDFKTVQLIMRMLGKERDIENLKVEAENKLRMTLDHRDREFWWAGGMHHGGIAACYDNTWGLSLNFIAVSKLVIVKRH